MAKIEHTSFVSGLSQFGQSTNLLIKPSNKFCNFSQSCDPLTIYRSSFAFICTCAPNSQPKNLVTSNHKEEKSCFVQNTNPILTCWWTIKGLGNSSYIDQNSFDAITCTFNFGCKFWHLITIKHIIGLTINIYHCHDCKELLNRFNCE